MKYIIETIIGLACTGLLTAGLHLNYRRQVTATIIAPIEQLDVTGRQQVATARVSENTVVGIKEDSINVGDNDPVYASIIRSTDRKDLFARRFSDKLARRANLTSSRKNLLQSVVYSNYALFSRLESIANSSILPGSGEHYRQIQLGIAKELLESRMSHEETVELLTQLHYWPYQNALDDIYATLSVSENAITTDMKATIEKQLKVAEKPDTRELAFRPFSQSDCGQLRDAALRNLTSEQYNIINAKLSFLEFNILLHSTSGTTIKTKLPGL